MGKKKMKRLAELYAPIICFHSKEKYFPCSIEYFIKYCSIWNGKKELRVIKRCLKLPSDEKYKNISLKFNKKYKHGQTNEIHQNEIKNIPYYFYFYETKKSYRIVYIFIFPYNGSKTFNIKHVTFDIDKITEKLQKVHFPGNIFTRKWVNVKDLRTTRNKVIIYSSKFYHRLQKTDKNISLFCWENIRNNKIYWNSSNIILIDKDTHWNKFPGRIGNDKNNKIPLYKSWYK